MTEGFFVSLLLEETPLLGEMSSKMTEGSAVCGRAKGGFRRRRKTDEVLQRNITPFLL